MCRECLCFSKLCPSNIYPSCVRFGKLHVEYSPLVCQTKHPAISGWFHLTLSVWKQTFPLQHDVVSRAGSYILRFCFNSLRAPDGKGLLHGDCSENGDHIKKSIIESQLLSCDCSVFHITLQSRPTGTCSDPKNTIEAQNTAWYWDMFPFLECINHTMQISHHHQSTTLPLQ